jgi:hypothetical protein
LQLVLAMPPAAPGAPSPKIPKALRAVPSAWDKTGVTMLLDHLRGAGGFSVLADGQGQGADASGGRNCEPAHEPLTGTHLFAMAADPSTPVKAIIQVYILKATKKVKGAKRSKKHMCSNRHG